MMEVLHPLRELNTMPHKSKKAGRRSYLDTIVTSIVRGGNAAGIPTEAIKAQVLQAVQEDVRVGGRDGRTIAEIIDMCAAALEAAGHPTDREEIIRILANPKIGMDAARIFRDKGKARNKSI